jgi:predicted SAM-dependent methyltransferase
MYRNWGAPPSRNEKMIWVHLGPGQKNYLPGWVNVDANFLTAKIDVWADLRFALPFKDESIDFFYSHHVIEHLPDMAFHFREMYRCLKPGGGIRIGGPNGDSAIVKFVENDHSWFGDFPDKRISIGGRFENFIFCRQEHLTILTYSYLGELLGKTGFSMLGKCIPSRDTNFPDVINERVFALEGEDDFQVPHTLLVEAVKPGNR